MKKDLLAHYITVAVRSLERYKTQSVISIVGLAVGFVCLSLSALWLRYDNTYNTFIPDYQDKYAIASEWDGKYLLSSPSPLVKILSEWPEVAACSIYDEYISLFNETGEYHFCLFFDQNVLDFLPIEVVQGDPKFMEHFTPGSIVLTDEYAKRLFGTEDPIGQKLTASGVERTVVAIVRSYSKHTTFRFDHILPSERSDSRNSVEQILVHLHPGADVRKSFEEKISEAIDAPPFAPFHIKLIPLTKLHHYDNNNKLSYAHMRAFLLASILLTACALINFLTLYLNRLRGRKREMALRLVHGSSHRGLVAMFAVELLVTLGSAIVLGMVGVFVLKDVFADFAGIRMGGGYIMGHALLIMLGVLAVCLLLSLGAVEIVRRRTLSSSISPAAARRHVFSSASIGVQLTVSLCFVFCAVVMLRQLWFMKNTDQGARLKDNACLTFQGRISNSGNLIPVENNFIKDNALDAKLAELPAVEDVMIGSNFYTGNYSKGQYYLKASLEDEGLATECYMDIFDPANPIYGFTVLEGTLPKRESWNDNEIIICESTRDMLGLKEALGKTIYYRHDNDWSHNLYHTATVVAVIKDIQTLNVRQKGKPIFFRRPSDYDYENRSFWYINFSYHHGMKKEVEEQIAEMMKPYPDEKYSIMYAEEVYNEQFKSENNLSRLLTLVTAVCILIAIFGVYSIITLACRQRRKEIALRKIHGAKLRDILGMFVNEYGLILVISSLVAFAVGYLIMHGWLGQYLKRITIGPLFYIGIFVATALLIALCVGARVWRTARENPADVVKSE